MKDKYILSFHALKNIKRRRNIIYEGTTNYQTFFKQKNDKLVYEQFFKVNFTARMKILVPTYTSNYDNYPEDK